MKPVIRIKKYNERIKACPFCGSPAEIVKARMITSMYVIRCTNDACGADIVFSGCELDAEKSLEHFNHRADGSFS